MHARNIAMINTTGHAVPIHCAFALRDESGVYYRNTYITLLSLLEHSSAELVIHILHDDTIGHGRKDLESLCARYGQALKFHKVPPIPADIVEAACQRFHFSALYRLFVHEVIPADKALYFDSDLIFQCGVAELAAVDLGGAAAAAVIDEGGHWGKGTRPKKRNARLVAKAGFSPATYFNAGVMLYDLNRMREASVVSNVFWKICREFYREGLHMLHADQDLLNIYCARYGGALFLDQRFNYLLYAKGRMYDGAEQLDGKILHFADPQTKPQSVLCPAQLRFWKYYAMTPWGSDVFEQMEKVFHKPGMAFFTDYIRHSRRRGTLAVYAAGGLGGLFKARFKKLFK